MPDLISPEAIAALLTPAQRQALLWLPDKTIYARIADTHLLAGRLDTMKAVSLAENIFARLVTCTHTSWSPTALGLRVRAVVEREGGADG